MKTKILMALSILILTVSSCKKINTKPTQNPQKGIDITKAVNSSDLYITRIINDEDTKKQSDTQKSIVFANKLNPELTIDKSGSYALIYKDSLTSNNITEKGTWTTNITSNSIILKGPVNEYTFVINTLNQEDFVITHMIQGTKSTKTNEGVISTQSVMVEETLYMEDND